MLSKDGEDDELAQGEEIKVEDKGSAHEELADDPDELGKQADDEDGVFDNVIVRLAELGNEEVDAGVSTEGGLNSGTGTHPNLLPPRRIRLSMTSSSQSFFITVWLLACASIVARDDQEGSGRFSGGGTERETMFSVSSNSSSQACSWAAKETSSSQAALIHATYSAWLQLKGEEGHAGGSSCVDDEEGVCQEDEEEVQGEGVDPSRESSPVCHEP